jgi:hypothetical protein
VNREEAASALELLTRVVRQARDDSALQNWGTIWMLHGLTNGAAFVATDVLLDRGHSTPWPFAALWAVVVSFNLATIALLKKERSGVASFVERQIWSIWNTFVAAMVLAALVNWLMGLHVFFMAPVSAILAVFAYSMMGALVGRVWYAVAALFVVVAVVTAALPSWKLALFGVVWALVQSTGGFLLERQRRARVRTDSGAPRIV